MLFKFIGTCVSFSINDRKLFNTENQFFHDTPVESVSLSILVKILKIKIENIQMANTINVKGTINRDARDIKNS